jgi:hypothetical protein
MAFCHEKQDHSEMHAGHHCPSDQRRKSLQQKLKHNWLIWTLPITGLLALIWFLVRVIPKPSRALYPCQRLAMPLASGFVAWLIGLVGVFAALRKAKYFFRHSYAKLAVLCLAVALVFAAVALVNMPETPLSAAETEALAPMGQGRGIHPGRVVWVHDPDATDWKGPGQGHLWQNEHTSQAVCDEMMSKALRGLTDAASDAAAWDAVFRYHNKARAKGSIPYRPGEKIVIKVNFVGFIRIAGSVDSETYELEGLRDYMNTSPQMIFALLTQLTQTVGVKQADIAVGDSLTYFAKEYYDILHKSFPNVQYLDCQGQSGRTRMELSSEALHWSHHPKDCQQDYVPRTYAEADYLINLANLKAHPGSGVTLCAKNHYGSLVRLPPEKGYYDMHKSAFSKGTAEYRNLVDLMGHAHLGAKTVLYLIDGLYGGLHYAEEIPRRFKSAPFNNDWTSSLFVSQDPVAIDSVGLDFLQAEIKKVACMPGTDDYLHEAALAGDPPSGTFYDPDHQGDVQRLASLGVHEHWNNAQDKQYSRNLGRDTGIELLAVTEKD